MNTNAVGIALIKSFEGCRLKAYQDQAGVWTCGWGATGPDIREGTRWTQDRADREFALSVELRESAVLHACLTAPTDNQFAAMVSLVYNIGVGAFLHGGIGGKPSAVLRLHNKGDFIGAAKAFGLWNKVTVNGVKKESAGLTRRRAAEAQLYLTPSQIDEAVAPQHTGTSNVEERPLVQDATRKLAYIATSAAAASGAVQQVVAQTESVWNDVQALTGGYGAHVLIAVTGIVMLGAAVAVLWALRRRG